ncbi:MAG: alpha/beta hydrolase [Vitreoscilla sp.]|nr:alpha/beta hydrolase [Vitreoscilla sp.]
MSAPTYTPRRPGTDRFVPVRGLDYHVITWGDPSLATPERPPLFMVHGWMDVGASFQFVVDALAALEGDSRYIVAADWRGFGLTRVPATDSYWFADYVGDLDALLHHADLGLAGEAPVDLLGHSMGGNVVMSYAGVRPERIRRLVNLEGFGLPETKPHQAPKRLRQWLDELRTEVSLRSYATVDEVAERLLKNNPRLDPAHALWLAQHWAEQRADGRWHILGDPAHKRANPVIYRKDEILEGWKLIAAPVLWVEGNETDVSKWWGNRYPRADFDARLAVVPQVERVLLTECGHMLHHDQPERLAAALKGFL